MRGPYNQKEILIKIQKLEKNRSYSQREAAETMEIDRQTMWRMLTLYKDNLNYALEAAGAPHRIREIKSKVVKGVKVEGCEFGPLGVVRWPVRPRVVEWIKERPKIMDWLMDHPTL